MTSSIALATVHFLRAPHDHHAPYDLSTIGITYMSYSAAVALHGVIAPEEEQGIGAIRDFGENMRRVIRAFVANREAQGIEDVHSTFATTDCPQEANQRFRESIPRSS